MAAITPAVRARARSSVSAAVGWVIENATTRAFDILITARAVRIEGPLDEVEAGRDLDEVSGQLGDRTASGRVGRGLLPATGS